MTARRTTTRVPYTADEMFDLVADVKRYPEFVPHCTALRILQSDAVNGQGTMIAEMVVAYRAFRDKFKSRVTLDKAHHRIEADYLEGPFRKLHNIWRFEPLDDGSNVEFTIDFEFRNVFMQATAGFVFERVFAKMSDAFIARASVVYGER